MLKLKLKLNNFKLSLQKLNCYENELKFLSFVTKIFIIRHTPGVEKFVLF